MRGGTTDVVIVGGGLAGFVAATRLQAQGLSTVVIEQHRTPGGCAGFWKTHGFAFDVGATTFVDFEPEGVGGRWLREIGADVPGELLPGYRAVLPDREVTLWRDPQRWRAERAAKLGDTAAHRGFWALIDRLDAAFWEATRTGRVRMPIGGPRDAIRAASSLDPQDWPLARYLRWTMGDALRAFGLEADRPLRTVLGMMLEDTVHSSVDAAPLVNGAMGINIRGAGLTRFAGGAWGLWRALIRRYRELGGILRLNTRVERIEAGWEVICPQERWRCREVVAATPIRVTAGLAPDPVRSALQPWIARDASAEGGALMVFLGVPEDEVSGPELTHHGLFHDYDLPFGDGNNMFVSVSAPGDGRSAPDGLRAVMISTHCELAPWRDLRGEAYVQAKWAAGKRLIALARRIYPRLGERPALMQVGTPQTYAHFAGRPGGAVGGPRQTLANTNQRAVPHDIGVPGFHLVGDTTWPGLGTVSCVIGGRLVSDAILATRPPRPINQ